jgi:hypothetical protein
MARVRFVHERALPGACVDPLLLLRPSHGFCLYTGSARRYLRLAANVPGEFDTG